MSESPCGSSQARQFDFWLGEWNLAWPAEQAGGEPGTTMSGTNRITKLFGPCAIEENFSTDDGTFQGHSVSVYDESAGLWRQTWVDSAGAYLSFSGGMEGADMVLSTEPMHAKDGRIVVNRMVFSDMTTDSLFWQWQMSPDGGSTWKDRWTITYQRHDAGRQSSGS